MAAPMTTDAISGRLTVGRASGRRIRHAIVPNTNPQIASALSRYGTCVWAAIEPATTTIVAIQ